MLRAGRNGFVNTAYGARGRSPLGATLTLGAGQKMKEIDVRLMPQGVVAGRVLDEDGEPVPYVNVQLERFQYRQGKKQLNPTGGGSRNDLGEFRIFGVSPGKYYLLANAQNNNAPGNAQDRSANAQPEEEYMPTYFPGTADPNNAAQVEVGAGALVSGLNFTLSKTPALHIRGRIANNPSDVRRPIQIYLTTRNTVFFGALRGTPADSRGNFDIRGVAPGQYWLNAPATDGTQTYTARVAVDVGRSNVENVAIFFGSPLFVPGGIRIEGNTQQDLSNVQVSLQPYDPGSILFTAPATAFAKEGNSFQLRNVQADVFDVRVTGLPDGFYVKSIKCGDTDVLANGLDFTKGVTDLLDVFLSPNAALISGVVQNPNTSQPAPGAMVVLVPQEKERRDQQQYYRTANTDQNGTYTLKSVVPGEYKLFAWEDIEPGAYMDPEFLKPVESKGEALTLRESDRKSVTITLIPADSETQTAAAQR